MEGLGVAVRPAVGGTYSSSHPLAASTALQVPCLGASFEERGEWFMSDAQGALLADLASKLYGGEPAKNLFHYTSLDGILGIHRDEALWATSVQYFSDSSELRHAIEIFDRRIDFLIGNDLAPKDVLTQLRVWLRSPLYLRDASLYAICFTERRDSLSQWRGYTPLGRGICIEFLASDVIEYSKAHSYKLARCIYDYGQKTKIVEDALDVLVKEALSIGPSGADSSRSYFVAFDALQQDLLRIAVTFKDEAFADEEEWRAVLKHDGSTDAPTIKYRVGKGTLIPYVSYPLKHPAAGSFGVWNLWVGPTPSPDLSKAALKSLFAGQIRCGRYPVMSSRVPYRET
jgi:hypothetical protein